LVSGVDMTEQTQRKILLAASGWLPLKGGLIGEGRGARVVSRSLLNRLRAPRRTPGTIANNDDVISKRKSCFL
jgi:hypothetical protein